MVQRAPDVASLGAALSSVVGYYERQLPIIGPPVPKRIENLLIRPIPGLKPLDAREQALLSKTLYEIQDRNLEVFLEHTRAHPNESDGIIRSYILQKHRAGEINDTLRQIARDRLQDVSVEKRSITSGVPFGDMVIPLSEAVDRKNLALLYIRDSALAYVSVGYQYGGELLIVIDPAASVPKPVPAEQILLTDEDRKSGDPWSKQARELVAKQTVLVDELTSCKGSRPAGLRFLNTGRLRDRADAYIVRAWTLSDVGVRQLLQSK